MTFTMEQLQEIEDQATAYVASTGDNDRCLCLVEDYDGQVVHADPCRFATSRRRVAYQFVHEAPSRVSALIADIRTRVRVLDEMSVRMANLLVERDQLKHQLSVELPTVASTATKWHSEGMAAIAERDAARTEAAGWRLLAEQTATGRNDGANGVALSGVCQFLRAPGPNRAHSEHRSRCNKHISHHFGGTQYRCFSLRDDEQASNVFGGEAAAWKAREGEAMLLVESAEFKAGEWKERAERAEAQLDYQNGCLEAVMRAEAAVGQMRAQLLGCAQAQEEEDAANGTGVIDAVACRALALASDAGEGWVSPETHAEVCKERDEAREELADIKGTALVLTRNSAERRGKERDALRAQLAEVTAQAAVMREAWTKYRNWHCKCGEDRCSLCLHVDRALAPDAGRTLAERVRVLEEVAGAARVAMPTTHTVECDEDEMGCICGADESPPAFRDALAKLDALTKGCA